MLPLAMTFVAVAFTSAHAAAASRNDKPSDNSTNGGPCQAITEFVEARLPAPVIPQDLTETGIHFPCKLPRDKLLNFLIATVPNPIDTHLALWFDRAVESIQNAAGSVGLRFQEAWIPWDTDLVREQPDITSRKAQQAERALREKEPGVLLFRGSGKCDPKDQSGCDLVVLLVPETPTGGIQPEVFFDATKIVFWASAFVNGLNEPKIPIVGPSFVGSFASLEKIREGKGNPEIKDRLRARSGSVGGSGPSRNAFKGEFSSTVHGIETQLQVLHEVSEGWKDQRIGLLSETETAFGWLPSDLLHSETQADNDLLIFRYPREISRLRSAYGDQELKAVVGAQQTTPSFRNLLAFRLFDLGPGTDSTPILAQYQTPLSQDAVLEQIARALERDRITLAGILATDVFDSLFIARYLRDACPNVRLLTFDSDLLYERAAEEFPFDGILALTTYPLIPSNEGWTNPNHDKNRQRLLFSSRLAEGVYNATRSLLIESKFALKTDEGAPLADYFNPARYGEDNPGPSFSVPPVWLMVLSRSGYWPLAVAGEPTADKDLLPWYSSGSPRFGRGSLPRLWQMFFVLLVLTLGWYFSSSFRQGRGFLGLNIVRGETGWLARFCYRLVCSMTLLAMYGLYIAPLIWIGRTDSESEALWFSQLAAGLFWLFTLLAFTPLLTLSGSGGKPTNPEAAPSGGPDKIGGPIRIGWPDGWHYGILFLAALIATIFTWCVLRLFAFPVHGRPLKYKEAFFLAYRSFHLSSGVSPLVPLLILVAAYFAWGRVHLTRVTILDARLIDVPPLGTGKEEGLNRCLNAINAAVNEPMMRLWGKPADGLRAAGAMVIVLAVAQYLASALRSFEYAPFDILFPSLLAILYGLLFLTWTRFLVTWGRFREFLLQLERHPMRFAFSELPAKRAVSPLLQFTAAHMELTALVEIRERLQKLRKDTLDSTLLVAIADLDVQVGGVLERVANGIRTVHQDAASLRTALEAVNDKLLENLKSFWESGRSERNADDSKKVESSKGDAKDVSGPKDPGANRDTSPEGLREEVIALQYNDYIQYILHPQRNLLMFAITAFVLAIVALHAYPFQAPGTITTFITLMFVAFASGVIVVLAQAERDPILSRITRTKPGQLSGGFFLRITGYLGIPLITVLGSQFPSIGRFLFSWIQPLLEAIK
jgi:hypothetical protein